MKAIFEWIIKNLWNLFTFIGVIGTLYFSILHVPDYVKDITTGKVNVVHESLMDDIQEILFYEKELSIEDISSFIQGKELKQDVAYPYNPDELLVQVQERFMGNKFIPLEKREALLQQIKSIRANYKPPQQPVKKAFDWVGVFSWSLSALGVLIASLGATSIVKKFKLDKETEVDIVAADVVVHNFHGSLALAALEYEKMVGEVLSELGTLKSTGNSTTGFNFLTGKGSNEYIVVVKRYRKLLGLCTAREFMYQVNSSGKGGILVVSSGVTKRTKQLIHEHNEVADNQKVHLVVGRSKSSVKKQIERIFGKSTSNK